MSRMTGGGKPGRRGSGSDAEPIDLDMTPIMNILIILISFMVTMVVFTHLAVIRLDLPPSASPGEGDGASPARKDLTVALTEKGFQIFDEDRRLDPLPRSAKGYDFAGLRRSLEGVKKIHPSLSTLILLVDTSVIYQDLIYAMDACREARFPDILLSGGLVK